MRYLFLLLVTMVALHSNAQQRTFSGKVIDKDKKKRVPFCLVMAKDRNEGTYCDDNGMFSFTVNTDSVQTLVFYCLGYQRVEMPVAQFAKDSTVVALQPDYSTLKDVTIRGRKGKMKDGILGRKSMKHIGDCYQKYGEEDAVYFRADSVKDGTLQEVRVYITSEGVPDSKFRIHVYEKDPVTNMPGKDITDSNVIIHGNAGNEWVMADLSNKNIPLNAGVFVSVEWISGYGNNTSTLQSSKHSEVSNHNGQVLGLALNYGVPYMYHRNAFHTEWGFTSDRGERYADYMCPMIYCTYSYVKVAKTKKSKKAVVSAQ